MAFRCRGRWASLVGAVLWQLCGPAFALDIDRLWDFQRPDVTEQRMREALANASADQALILHTQISRTHGLRRNFVRAREVLLEVEPGLAGASPEGQVRWHLEMGRTWVSAAHSRDSRTPEAQTIARRHYLRAADVARASGLDGLAVDAWHMMAFVDTEPAQQMAWNQRALDLALNSTQATAQRWEGSLRHNMGLTLKQLGELEAALHQFKLSGAAYQRFQRTRNARIADWMVASILRSQGKLDEAIAIQQRLEALWDADGQPDPYVFQELEALYRAKGDTEEALRYAARRAASGPNPR